VVSHERILQILKYIDLLLLIGSSMVKELLKRLGLSTNEINTYLALMELGQTTTGPLIKKSGVPSSKIYQVLSSLEEKGLVGHLAHGGVKIFRANRPIALRHLMDMREKEVEKLKDELEDELPSLEKEFLREPAKYNVEILEGLRGIKTVYDFSLEYVDNGESMRTIGYPILASKLLNAYFKKYHERISRKGVRPLILYDYDTWFGKKREERPHAKQRYLPKGIRTPGFIHIFRDHIAIMVVTENQKLSILIKNKEISDSYKQYFDLLWKNGKKTEIKK
jgi:sugar-specific transcriptional regulator TrmB